MISLGLSTFIGHMSDLNDFFSKKDKKKSKGGFTTINDIDKKLQEPGEKKDRPNLSNKDDEWKEFEETIKDYSGLKIQNILIEDDVEDSHITNDVPQATCPWNVQLDEPEKALTLEGDSTVTTPKAYVPPHLRNKQSSTNSSGANSSDFITSHVEDGFPTLTSTYISQGKSGTQHSKQSNKPVLQEKDVTEENVSDSSAEVALYKPPHLNRAYSCEKTIGPVLPQNENLTEGAMCREGCHMPPRVYSTENNEETNKPVLQEHLTQATSVDASGKAGLYIPPHLRKKQHSMTTKLSIEN